MEETIRDQNLSNKKDRWTIPGAPNGEFTTAWYQDCMETHKTMGQIPQNFWNKWIPKRHNIFIWRLVRKGIPTRVKLSKMGLDIPSTLCPLCEDSEEDVKHLFYECPKTAIIWQKLGHWWAVDIPRIGDTGDLFRCAWSKQKNVKDGLRLQLVLVAVLVRIWKARNGIIFEKQKMDVEKEFRNSQELAYLWISSRNSKFKMELNNWVLNPRGNM